MKVLHVMAGAEAGGAETAFADTCLAMKENGFDIEVVSRPNKRNAKLASAGIKIHELSFGGALDVYTSWQLKKIIEKFQPQIVQTWMSRASQKTPANPDKYLKVARLGGYYALKYFKTADYFIANTPDIKDYLIKQGIARSRVAHINNFSPVEHASEKLSRAEMNTPEDAVVVLALGRLHKVKALDVLMKAVVDFPKIHVWLAGEGPLRDELEALAKDLNIAERIHFLGWRDDRSALLEACDICVFPSRFEPFGNVFVQAWAHKVPLITSNSEGPSQYVKDGEDALVFPIDDIESLKRQLSTLIADISLAQKLTENGYRRYLEEFTAEKTVEAYRAFYADILARDNLTR